MTRIERRIQELEEKAGMQTIPPMTIAVNYVDSNGEVEPGFSFEIGSNGMRKETER